MLEILAKYHKEWVLMGKAMGIPDDLVEDFVQECYIRINKYVKDDSMIMFNDTEPNKFYFYRTLRNLWMDYNKEKSKFNFSSVDAPNFYITQTTEGLVDYTVIKGEKDLAEEKLLRLVENEVESWDYWYDKKLFNIYYHTDITMRKLAEETGISVSSIYNSLKNYRQRLKDEIGEDWEDYLNEEYDKI